MKHYYLFSLDGPVHIEIERKKRTIKVEGKEFKLEDFKRQINDLINDLNKLEKSK